MLRGFARMYGKGKGKKAAAPAQWSGDNWYAADGWSGDQSWMGEGWGKSKAKGKGKTMKGASGAEGGEAVQEFTNRINNQYQFSHAILRTSSGMGGTSFVQYDKQRNQVDHIH